MNKVSKLLVIISGISISLGLLVISPVQAFEYCRTVDGHKICILSLQRSAKNYWEYRASVSIDQQKPTSEVFDCRPQNHSNQQTEPSKHEVEMLVCTLMPKH